MADNVLIPGTGSATAAADEVTFSGDVVKVQLTRPVSVTGSEGSKTVVDLVATAQPATDDAGLVTRPASSAPDLTASGTIDGEDETVALALEGHGGVGVLITTSSFVGTLRIEQSIDGGVTYTLLHASAEYILTDPTDASRPFWIEVTGFSHVRVRAGAYTSGSAAVAIRATPAGLAAAAKMLHVDGITASGYGVPIGGVDSNDAYAFHYAEIYDADPPSAAFGLVTRPASVAPDVTASGTITANGQNIDLAIQGRQSVSLQINGSYSGTVVIWGSVDGGITWTTAGLYFWYPDGETTLNVAGEGFAGGNYGPLFLQTQSALTHIRARGSDWSSGTAAIEWRASMTPTSLSAAVSRIAPASGTPGLVTREAARGQATMANSIPVTLASDQSAVTIAALPNEGQQTMANSISVAVASNQSAVPISGNITNAGTFAVQESGAALTALQLIDDPVATLGTTTYAEAATKGIIVGAVRRDADTTLVDTTNEVGPLQMDANGRLKVEAFSGETLPVSLTSTTVTGTVAVTQSGTWDEVGINDSGNVITVDGSGSAGTAATGVVSVQGIASMTPVQVGDNSSSITVDAPNGTPVFVRITDASLNAGLVDETGSSAVDALAVGGGTPHDSADSGNPIKVGAKAANALPTAVANNDRANLLADLWGRLMVCHIDPAQQKHANKNFTSTQTGSDVITPTSGKKLAITSVVVGTYGTTAGRVILWFGDNADTTFTQDTDQVLVAFSTAPSSSSKPALVFSPPVPVFCATADRELHLTTDAGVSLDITIEYYEW